MNTIENHDAGFGTGSQAEVRHLLPEEIERMQKLRETSEPAGSVALSTEYVFIGVEATGETTHDERKRRSQEEGISSHPIGWGVASYKRVNRSI